jgi:alpha-glucosidase (family GH31 glycosyl hydrolase)
VVLRRGSVEAILRLRPLAIDVRRGRSLIDGLRPWAAEGVVRDRFVQLTEGVIANEELERPRRFERAGLVDSGAAAGRTAVEVRGALGSLRLELHDERVVLELEPAGSPLRVGADWAVHPGERFTGLGARHGESFDQSERVVRLGADRRYTGPDCPPDMLDVGGIPQGDYAPLPWLLASRGYALWVETGGAGVAFELGQRLTVSSRAQAGPFRLHVLTEPTPAARLRSFLRLTNSIPPVLPGWAYGHWKSRDVYEHQAAVEDDFEGYGRHALPLDAIVIDSPWETQYNTWEPNPYQFPDFEGMVRRFRASGVRTVVWVAPWVNLESADGQRPPDAGSERLHLAPASNYAPAEHDGHFVRGSDGRAFVTRWWMGTGSPVDFTSAAAEEWWREQAKRVLQLGVEGIKADDGEGYYLPPDVRFADGRSGAEAAWAHGLLYRRSMQRALDEVHPETGVLFGRPGWTGQQAVGVTWGGDQASDFWSLAALVAATLTAAASGFSNWSHDIGGYLGERLVARCPKELLLRWVWFGCFTPLMHAHGRFPQEPWTYDAETLHIYRDAVLLHERLAPYVRAAAATAARCGLPVVRPLCLMDPSDERGWRINDAYGYGPALWVAPVLQHGVRERAVPLPRGDWVDFWNGERVRGGGELVVSAPLDRIPVYVRAGSIVVTYPASHVAGGLGDTPELERPLEATLWGEPRLGHAGVRLADGTRISWRGGEWSVRPDRELRFESR